MKKFFVLSILMLFLIGCGSGEKTASPEKNLDGKNELGEVLVSFGNKELSKTWAVCQAPGQRSKYTPWPESTSCSDINKRKDLLKPIEMTQKDYIRRQGPDGIIKSKLGIVQLPHAGSSTQLQRWKDLEKILSKDAVQQAFLEVKVP